MPEVLAAIYARTSPGPSQRDNYSIDEQVQAAWSLCERRDWKVSRVFVDDAISGKNTDRPMFLKMMEGARRSEFGALVVWKLDRFCRSLADLVNTQKELQRYGIEFASVTEALDTSSPAGRFNMRSLGSVAELERELIAERTRLGMYGLARARRWPNGRPPLGYDLDVKGRLVINADEARTVARIFDDYVGKRSMAQLAYDLNTQGVPMKGGARGRWTARAVRDILGNEVYVGVYDVAGIRDHMEGIRVIDDDLFHQAKKVRLRYTTGHSPRPSLPLSKREARIERVYARFQSFLGQPTAGELQFA
ncbi:MAG: recombinase family protein [Thaumarchaeota archaeon]|nr:recombinase family protein [Nitrososphaerota archaeon]